MGAEQQAGFFRQGSLIGTGLRGICKWKRKEKENLCRSRGRRGVKTDEGEKGFEDEGKRHLTEGERKGRKGT